jgi:hypothetical protein
MSRKLASEPRPKLTDAERHKRFVETAKKVDASDILADFDKAFDSLTRIAKVNSVRGKQNHK